MTVSALKRFALMCGLAAWSATAVAQEPAPAATPPADHDQSADGKRPITALEAKKRAAAAKRARPRRPRAQQPSSIPMANSPHGARRAGPRVAPAPDLPAGEIEVRLNAKDFENIEGREVTLVVSKQSIERGNVDTTLTARTDERGVARFSGQSTESDHIYRVQVAVDAARYSTSQFQFRGEDGMRALVPIYPSANSLDGLLLITRTLIALIPQDDLFVVDVLFRVENYGDISWLPENIVFPLPEGFRALNVRSPEADGHFEAAGDDGVKLVGTLAPGQHDLMFRFHLPTDGKGDIDFRFPTSLNTGMVRVILESSPSMKLEVPGFPEPDESRNQQGQRRLIAGRDFMGERARAPDDIQIKISGIPTPAAGRSVAVGLAAAIALGGIAQVFTRKRSVSPRSDLSREDRERASELLLEELISLEQAFQQGSIGRKTHDQAKRQLLEAFARLRADPDEDATADARASEA